MSIVSNSVTSEITSGENTFETTSGVVVVPPDKLGTNQVGVFIAKLFPSMDISESAKETSVKYDTNFLKNSKNKKLLKGSVKLQNYVVLYCKYPTGLAMPDLQVGQTVFVNFVDQDLKTMYCEESPVKQDGKKEGERVRIEAPAKKEGSDENVEITKDSAYALEIDSRKNAQRIELKTSKENGEKAAIRMSIDSKNGIFYVNAGGEEMFKYSVEDDEWLFKTAGGATFSMKDKVFEINCDELIINGESKIKMKTKDYQLESDKIKEDAKSVKLKYKDLNQEGTSAKFKIQQEKHQGLAFRMQHTIGVQVESVMFAVNGLVAAASLTFGAGPPSIDVPLSVPDNTMKVPEGNMDMGKSNITVKTGMMEMGTGGQSLAKASPIVNAVNKLAAFYDMLTVVGSASLIKMMGASGVIASDSSQVPSSNVKGL